MAGWDRAPGDAGADGDAVPRMKALVLELLAAVCLVRGGHEIILAAFDNFKEVRGEWEWQVWAGMGEMEETGPGWDGMDGMGGEFLPHRISSALLYQ